MSRARVLVFSQTNGLSECFSSKNRCNFILSSSLSFNWQIKLTTQCFNDDDHKHCLIDNCFITSTICNTICLSQVTWSQLARDHCSGKKKLLFWMLARIAHSDWDFSKSVSDFETTNEQCLMIILILFFYQQGILLLQNMLHFSL